MEMKSSSRPSFDRSREPGLKKPRLSDPFQQQLPPSSQQQRSVNSEMTRVSSSSRFRSSERVGGSDDTGRGPYQQQPQYMQQQQHEELISQYKIALGELTFNSKPIITNLTIIAGENLHAAKFIAAAICTNILEVPSEQKLPSLYLLDSIVKNIGKDYIKYFAARLPEVFCKAYSQVDPSIHPGMRHLFGTWKGVFPPQQLQIIEQELGFASAVNGLSGSATSRADSQFQRQPQAIHVNPKYLGLEARQRLQQSSRPKVTGTDISGTVIDSTEDLMKPDRTISIGAAKPWADPTMKLHNIQRPQREIARESIQQKQGAVGYGDYEYDAVLSKPLSAGMKRPSMSAVGQGYNKRWLGPGREVEESISSQRNGYDVRHGNSGYASNRSENMCMPFTQNARSGGDISKSWKNSEEEEYMWDDLSTDVSDRGAVDSMRKDRWTPDDPEKLESGTHISKWRSQPEVGSRNDRETSIDPLSADLKEQTPLGHMGFSLRQMQEPRQLDRLSSSTPEMGSRSMMGPTHQRPPSPSFSLRDPRQRDLPQRQVPPLPRSDHKTPPLQGQLNKGSQDKPLQDSMRVRPSNLPSGNLQKMQPQSVQKPGPLPQHVGPDKAEPSGQPQKALQLLGSLPTDLSLERPAADTPAHSNVSSLLAAVIKTGVISTSSAPGKVGTLPSFPTGSSSSHSTLSTWKRSTTAVVPSRDLVPTSPPKNLEKPPLASGFPPSSSPVASAGSVAFSSLLSTLVSSGLISAPKTESTAPEAPPDPRQNKTATSSTTKVPPIDKPSSSEPASINSDTSSQDMKLDIEDLVGYEFKPPILRKFHPAVVDKLFDQLPHSCSQCGFRFKLQESLDKHLEWHAFKNSQANNTNKPSRRWYSSSVSWFAGKALFPYEYRFSGDLLELGEENLQMVPADESQCVCILCGELFEDFYSQERDEWMFKDAVYMTVSPRSCESESCSKSRTPSLILHSKCMSNDAARELGLVHDIKEEGEDA